MRHQSSWVTHTFTQPEIQNMKGKKNNRCVHTPIRATLHHWWEKGRHSKTQSLLFSPLRMMEIKDYKKKWERKKDSHKDVWHYLFLLCFSLQRRDMKNLQQWIFKALMGCTQIDAAGETERAGVSLSSGLQRSLSSSCQMSRWMLMKWWQLGPLASSPCYFFFVFRLCLMNVCLPFYFPSHKLSACPSLHLRRGRAEWWAEN